MLRVIYIFTSMLFALILVDCSAGNSINQQQTYSAYLMFSESSIILETGESAEVTLYLMNTNIVPLYPLSLYSSESGIVTLTPNTCTLQGSPLNCNFIITGTQPGTTQISADGVAPGQPMSVIVIP